MVPSQVSAVADVLDATADPETLDLGVELALGYLEG
jgi:hypothetical protein